MPKAQSKGGGGQKKKRIQQEPGVNEQQNEQIDSEDKEGDLQDSCTKNVIDEKIAAFFDDRSFFYDIENEHYKNRSRRDAELGEFAASIGMDRK